jgi:hypothetical protein
MAIATRDNVDEILAALDLSAAWALPSETPSTTHNSNGRP